MHICMKSTANALAEIKARLASAYKEGGLSQAEIARLAGVDPSQVSRICRGQFKRASPSVMQICNVLGIRGDILVEPGTESGGSWARMLASLRELWDETPEGADSILRMLDAVAALRRAQ